jgi:hypothetical protein
VERAVNEADKRDLIDPEALRTALDSYKGEPGAPLLRKLLDKGTFRLSDSDLEILFRPIAVEAGLPFPLSKQMVNGWEVDFTGRTSGWSSRRTACVTTAQPRPKPETPAATEPMRSPDDPVEKSSRWSTSWKRATAGVGGQADQGRREPE